MALPPVKDAAQTAFPRRVGAYDLLVPIGVGGTATVYLARPHETAEHRPAEGGYVAVKLMHAPFQSSAESRDAATELFEEARLASRIQHPNVIPVLDMGEEPAGIYLTMTYVEGASLALLLRKTAATGSALEPGVALRILIDAMAGLEAAHELRDESGAHVGLVHRDFSPQNILVGVDGRTRLGDFGIAWATSRAHHTRTGVVKGKVAYMSPEQALGETLDQRSDVWAAGVVAWETFAGRPLFQKEDAVTTMLRVVNDTPPRLHAFRPDLPAALDEAVAWALTPQRHQRCPTVSLFAQRLLEAWAPAVVPAAAARVGALVQVQAGETLAERRALARAAQTSFPDLPAGASRLQSRRRALLGVVLSGGAAAAVVIRRRHRVPVAGQSAPPSPQPVVLASAQLYPLELAQDDEWLYWTALQGVFKIHKKGETGWHTRVLESSGLRQLAVDEEMIYVASGDGHAISRVSKKGGDDEVFAPAQRPTAVCLDETHVYWADSHDGTIWCRAKSDGHATAMAQSQGGSVPRILNTEEDIWSVVVDDDSIYWTDSKTQQIMRTPKGGGTSQVVVQRARPLYGMIVRGPDLFWREGHNNLGDLLRVPKSGGEPAQVTSGHPVFPRGLFFDRLGDRLYFSSGSPRDGQIYAVDPTGDHFRVIADWQLGPHSLVVDRTHVFWTNWAGGTVMKLEKTGLA